MKKILIFTILILSSSLLSLRVSAQTPVSAPVNTDPFQSDQAPEVNDVEGFRAEFQQGVQDPDTKQVTFKMVLKSGIDSDRVKITWTLSGVSGFLNISDATRNIVVQSGQTYTIPITIVPSGLGVTELRGKAEAFKADSSYLVTVRKDFATNSSAEVLPITSEYTQAKTLSLVKTVVIVILIFLLLVVAALWGFKRFVKWLNRDDRK